MFLSVSAHADPAAQPLLQKADLVYEGAFRVPGGALGAPDAGRALHSGGSALAYNPANNSLFIVGHQNYQLTAEIGIPQIKNISSLGSLNTASALQNLKDVTDGKIDNIDTNDNSGNWIGGQLVYNGQLIASAFGFYDADGSATKSHFTSSLNLAQTNDAQGPFTVGNLNPGHVAGYMGLVPSEWQALLGGTALTGNCCLSITSRTSVGPSASAFNPTNLGVQNPVPAPALVDYDLGHPITNPNNQNALYVQGDWLGGVVFPSGTRSVLFFGRHGTGPVCYGDGGPCGDPANGDKGYHAYPYKYQVWAYDANDLVKVKNGLMQPWQAMPYAVWNFNLPFESNDMHLIKGAAYNPATQEIFISQDRVDSSLPVIHVFKVTVGAPPPPGSVCDLNGDSSTNVSDIQLGINQSIGTVSCLPFAQTGSADINQDGQCNVIDVQRVVNAALGGLCVSP